MGKLIEKGLRKKIKTMSLRNLELLTYEIRDFLISSVSESGGHLASNLGVVELTVALHSVFDVDSDRIIWDVGHQVYVHKILTGRANAFPELRQYGGISGFPKTGEDPSDVYNSGHSSASISAAMGLAEARDLKGDDYNVVAVIGDGALTGGLAYEGLNNAGNRQTRMIVILNDNEMSISNNTGSVAQYLSKLRTSPSYQSTKNTIRERMAKIPRVGESMVQGAERMMNLMRYAVVHGTLFEELGFKYYGPVDGHNLKDLIEILEAVKTLDEPVLIHIVTKKGKGYINAEKNPGRFHGIAPFDPETGALRNKNGKSWSEAAGESMLTLAAKDPRIVCISAAMTDAVGLKEFAKIHYQRFFDVGIAEEHAVTFAAGLAIGEMRPFVFIYSTFLQRAYDQIMMEVCAQKLPVVFMIDRAGNVGSDGETHHGIFDLSYLGHVPGLVFIAPKDEDELKRMTEFVLTLDGPAAIRYPRGEMPKLPLDDCLCDADNPIELGKFERLYGSEDTEVELIAVGKMVQFALDAAIDLNKEGIKVGVVNARFVSPIDEEMLVNISKRGAKIVTLEDNVVTGGFGQKVSALLALEGFDSQVLNIGWPDLFVTHGSISKLMSLYGLDTESIKERVRSFLSERKS